MGKHNLEMIAANRQSVQDWLEFEVAYTYEYSHEEVKRLNAVSSM
jgi:hypothetical protein